MANSIVNKQREMIRNNQLQQVDYIFGMLYNQQNKIYQTQIKTYEMCRIDINCSRIEELRLKRKEIRNEWNDRRKEVCDRYSL